MERFIVNKMDLEMIDYEKLTFSIFSWNIPAGIVDIKIKEKNV